MQSVQYMCKWCVYNAVIKYAIINFKTFVTHTVNYYYAIRTGAVVILTGKMRVDNLNT